MFFIGVILVLYATFVGVFLCMLPGLTHQPLTKMQIVALALGMPSGLWGATQLGINTHNLEWIFILEFVFAVYSLYHLRYTQKHEDRMTEIRNQANKDQEK